MPAGILRFRRLGHADADFSLGRPGAYSVG